MSIRNWSSDGKIPISPKFKSRYHNKDEQEKSWLEIAQETRKSGKLSPILFGNCFKILQKFKYNLKKQSL